MLEQLLNVFFSRKAIDLPTEDNGVISQYIDVLNQYGLNSREERAYFKTVGKQRPAIQPLLTASLEVKEMFQKGYLD